MAIATRLLPLNAQVTQQSLADDGYGGSTLTYTVRHANWRCRIYSVRTQPQLVRTASGEEVQANMKALGEEKELYAGDVLVVNGTSYEVLGPDYPSNLVYDSNRPHHVEVYVRQLDA